MELLSVNFIVSGIALLAAGLASYLLMTMVLVPQTKEDGIRIVREDHGTAGLIVCGICLAIAGVAAIVERSNWAFFAFGLLGGFLLGAMQRWGTPD
jgi:hypothetical protein